MTKTWCPRCGPDVYVDTRGNCAFCGALSTGEGATLAHSFRNKPKAGRPRGQRKKQVKTGNLRLNNKRPQIESMLREGISSNDVAKTLGLTITYINMIRSKIGLKPPRKKNPNIEEIERLLLMGELTPSEIARKVKVSRQRVDQIGISLEGYVSKGMHRGSDIFAAKLTDDSVLCLRREYRKGVTAKDLAKQYGISVGALHMALLGRTWAHVPEALDDSELQNNTIRGSKASWSILKEKDVIEIRRLIANKECTQKELAIRYGVKETTLGRAVIGASWKHVPGALPHETKSRLGLELARQIRAMYEERKEERFIKSKLARIFDKSSVQITMILKGKMWKEPI